MSQSIKARKKNFYCSPLSIAPDVYRQWPVTARIKQNIKNYLFTLKKTKILGSHEQEPTPRTVHYILIAGLVVFVIALAQTLF